MIPGPWTVQMPGFTRLPRQAETQAWLRVVSNAARPIPRLRSGLVQVHYAPRWEVNAHDTEGLRRASRWVVAGLVSAGVFVDDLPERVHVPAVHVDAATGQPGRWWFTVETKEPARE